MTDLIIAFLDLQVHGRRPQNVILRLAAACGKLPLIFIPPNLTTVSSEPFRNVVFYHLRIPVSDRWGFTVDTILLQNILKGLAMCVTKQLYPLFRLNNGILCVYDRITK